MRDWLRLIAPVLKAVKERHDDPKNMAKGDYFTDVFEAWVKFNEESREASDEIMKYLNGNEDKQEVLKRLRYELADVILCAAMAINAVEKELNDEN